MSDCVSKISDLLHVTAEELEKTRALYLALCGELIRLTDEEESARIPKEYVLVAVQKSLAEAGK